MPANAPSLRLPVFEGPLELLLHLIEKNKIDIYDIPIFEITKQYLEYLKNWDDLNMEVASEFIVMAATLINIKARKLLPLAEQDGDGEDEEALLIARLLEYKRYKDGGRILGTYLPSPRKLIVWRGPEAIQGERPVPKPGELLAPVTMQMLRELALRAERSRRESVNPAKADFRAVRKEQYKVSDKIAQLKQELLLVERVSFLALKKDSRSKEETVAYFMAMLEMAHQNQLSLEQGELFGDITISRGENIGIDTVTYGEESEYA